MKNKVNIEMLNEYGDYFCLVMNTIYKHFKVGSPIISDDFVCCPFIYGDEPKTPIPNSIAGIENRLSYIIGDALKNHLDKKLT